MEKVGTYTVKAQISSDNYCGEKEFTVYIYSDTVEPDQPTKPDDKKPNVKKDSGESNANGGDIANAVNVAIGLGSGFIGISAIGVIIYYLIRRKKR